MKTVPIIFLIALTAVGLVAQRPTRPAPRKQTLADFRLNETNTSPKIPAGIQRSVLSKVFRRYLTDEARCNRNFDAGNGADPLRAARNAGQIVPLIVDSATGSFTASGQTQTAYVISVSECNASHADNYGTKRVAIFSGPQLVADMDVDFRGSIARKTDLNGDGLDELLMTTGDMNQGTLIEMASLVSFQNGRLRVIEDFGTVTEDSCASEAPGSSAKASVISYAEAFPGLMPKLHVDNYVAGCAKTRRWRFLSAGKMPD